MNQDSIIGFMVGIGVLAALFGLAYYFKAKTKIQDVVVGIEQDVATVAGNTIDTALAVLKKEHAGMHKKADEVLAEANEQAASLKAGAAAIAAKHEQIRAAVAALTPLVP